MRLFSQLFIILFMSLTFINSAFAAPQPTYAKKTAALPSHLNGKYSEVFVVNQTYNRYMVYATYKDTGRSFNMPLNPMGSYQDAIKFPISYPEYAVCLDVIQDATGQRIYRGCLSTETLYIHYTDEKTVNVMVKP